jgi:hypothetical protein
MGQLVAYLLDQSNPDAQKLKFESNTSIKKGAVWWLRQRLVNGDLQTYLFTVQNPDY